MLAQSFLNLSFPADRIFVKQASVSANIERQVLGTLCEQDCWFFQCVRVAELIEHILIGWCDLRDHDLRFDYPVSNVLKDNARPKTLACVICTQFVGFYHWFYHISV